MTNPEIHEKLTGVFRKVFDDLAFTIEPSMTANDVEGWDSLVNVSLMVAVEKAFGVRFTTKEVQSLANVGDLMVLIERRLK